VGKIAMHVVPAPEDRRFPRAARLKSRAHFERVYRDGSRARGDSLTVAVCANAGEGTRLGLSVGKRCWRGAVQRNRVRRVFREAFRLSARELPPDVDLVMIASTPALRPELARIRAELVRLAHKAFARHVERVARDARAADGRAET
jgi:ribonuclease P protein component